MSDYEYYKRMDSKGLCMPKKHLYLMIAAIILSIVIFALIFSL